MADNRNTISSLDDPPCQYYDDRSPSRLSRASSASSRFTREDVTIMNDNELDELCRQVFALCDTNGDGFITKDVSKITPLIIIIITKCIITCCAYYMLAIWLPFNTVGTPSPHSYIFTCTYPLTIPHTHR